jgi:hypothetical protein
VVIVKSTISSGEWRGKSRIQLYVGSFFVFFNFFSLRQSPAGSSRAPGPKAVRPEPPPKAVADPQPGREAPGSDRPPIPRAAPIPGGAAAEDLEPRPGHRSPAPEPKPGPRHQSRATTPTVGPRPGPAAGFNGTFLIFF